MWRKLLLVLTLSLLALVAVAFAFKPKEISADVIAASVNRDATLLARAWQLPAAAAYKRGLLFQSNGTLCGPTSLANVLRSLGEPSADADRVLTGSGLCATGLCLPGLTLDELAGLARHATQRKVTLLRNLTPEAFRQELLRSNQPGLRYVVNFARKALFGAGSGHHSPLGGYLEAEDLVLVLDVNRKFQPWLVSRARLYAAVDTLDGEHKRGLLRIE
jgi:hypothetical protein